MATTANQQQSLPQTIATALGRGKSRREIVQILCKSGIGADDAKAMVEYAASTQRAAVRKGALAQVGFGFVLLAGGIAITSASYHAASSGGMYVVFYGPVIFGALSVVRGLFRLVTA